MISQNQIDVELLQLQKLGYLNCAFSDLKWLRDLKHSGTLCQKKERCGLIVRGGKADRIAPIFFMEASFPTSYIQCGPLRLNRVLELTLLYKPDD